MTCMQGLFFSGRGVPESQNVFVTVSSEFFSKLRIKKKKIAESWMLNLEICLYILREMKLNVFNPSI